MIPATCPVCGMTTNCPDELAGKQAPCSGCGTNIPVVAGGADLLGGGLGGGGLGGYGGGYAAASQPAKTKGSSGSPWFFKWWVLALGGIGAVAAVGGVVFLISPKPRPVEVAQESPAEKPAASKPAAEKKSENQEEGGAPNPESSPVPKKGFAIVPLEAVALEPGGMAKIKITVNRDKVTETIPIMIEGLPAEVTAEPIEIPEGQSSAELTLAAAAEATASKEPAKIKLTAESGESKAEQELALTIKPLAPPNLSTVAALTLRPGASSTIDVKVDRKGYSEPITLVFEGLPEKVTASAAAAGEQPGGQPGGEQAIGDGGGGGENETGAKEFTIPAEASALKLTLTAGAEAADAIVTPKLTATIREQKVEAPIKLTIERFNVRVQPLPVVMLKPGESKTIDVVVERRSYKGALKLEPQGLPEKITAAPLEIAENATKAQLKVTAAADAKEQVKAAALAAKAENVNINAPLVVRVTQGEGSFIPAEVPAGSELAKLAKRNAFGGRQEAKTKQALVDLYGGNSQSEAAVLKGLAWLAKLQQESGRFAAPDGGAAGGEGNPGGESGLNAGKDSGCETLYQDPGAGGGGGSEDVTDTALALLPFLAAGVAHDASPTEPEVLKEYRTKVYKGLDFIGHQQISLRRDPKDGELPGGIEAHALGTIVLCEAYALSKDDRLKLGTQRAVKYLLQPHFAEKGWRGESAESGNADRMGWVCLALRSAQVAGFSLDRSALDKANKYLISCAAGPDDAKQSRYSAAPDGSANLTATAAGLFAREILGWQRDNSDLAAGCKYLMENLPPESGSDSGRLAYYCFATQALHNREGADWDQWNCRIRDHLLRMQNKEGEAAGSWNAASAEGESKTSRLRATTMALLTLETYYRHLPLYKRPIKVAEAK